MTYEAWNLPDYKPYDGTGLPPVLHGYDIDAYYQEEKERLERNAEILKRANGCISDGESKVLFFVESVKLNIGLSGNTGQGRYTRDFYPHNITMPSFQIIGQVLDQRYYGTLVEFVHHAQRESVGNASTNVTKVDVGEGGWEGEENYTMKGIHGPINVEGFIPTIQRKHVRFEYSPRFSFEIAVLKSNEGIYKDISYSEPEEQNWKQIIEGLAPFSQAPKAVKPATAKGSKPSSSTTQFTIPTKEFSFEELTGAKEP